MSEEKKELTPELKPKTNKSNIIKLVVLIGICIIAAVFLSKNKSKSTKETIEISSFSDTIPDDTLILSNSILNTDSISKIDTVQINKPKPVLTKKVKKKISRFKLENNPNYWIVSKSSNSDTSFYVLKNKRTGTKLSNKYYSKIEANNELRNFKKILSK